MRSYLCACKRAQIYSKSKINNTGSHHVRRFFKRRTAYHGLPSGLPCPVKNAMLTFAVGISRWAAGACSSISCPDVFKVKG